jgi:hypothetical protein
LRIQVTAEQDSWLVILQLHHLITDHMALETVVAELRAHAEGRFDLLSEPLPYRDYVWQSLQQARTSDAEQFFRERLAHIDESTAPFGLLEVHGDGTQIEESRELLPQELSTRLRGLAREFGVSTAVLFHVAWARVVAATSGRDEVVFGTILSGRLHGAPAANRLGMFINTLPVCFDLRERSVRELIATVQTELAELLRHESASLALAQRSSGVSAGAPLFTSLLNYRHSKPGESDAGEVHWRGSRCWAATNARTIRSPWRSMISARHSC